MLRSMLHLAVDPALEPGLTDDQRALIEGRAAQLGADALTRMLGLWLEQEPMLRDAANRELALEVAALRLARWPSIQRVERWLAGGQTPPAESAPPTPTATGDRGSDPPPPASSARPANMADDRGNDPPPPASSARPATLAEALWEKHPRLAGAIEAARVSSDDGVVTIRFGAEARASANYAGSDAVRSVLETACGVVFPAAREIRVEAEAEEESGGETPNALMTEAENDPAVILVREIIGGQIVAVRPDGGG